MNYTQNFEEFSSGLGPTDLALYAGVGIILYVLFKDRLSPVQKMIMEFINSFKATEPNKAVVVKEPEVPVKSKGDINSSDLYKLLNNPAYPVYKPTNNKAAEKVYSNKVFFDLISSWKETRDLAESYACEQAVTMLDEAFQYLSPKQCGPEKAEKESNE